MNSLDFYRAESNDCPDVLDITSSPTSVYVRRNIEKKTRTSEEGELQEYYSYEESVMSKDQYIQELHGEQEITEQAIQDLILSLEV